MKARFFAPATTGNCGPGFDIYGLAYAFDGEMIGDIVEATTTDEPGLTLKEIVYGRYVPEEDRSLPADETNLVIKTAKAILEKTNQMDIGIEFILHKNTPIAGGLGGSACSIAATAMAVNEIIPNKLTEEQLAEVVVACEPGKHPDNVLPALFGGFIFISSSDPLVYKRMGTEFTKIHFVIVHPDIQISTVEAREALKTAPYDVPALIETSQSMITEYLKSGNTDNPDISAIQTEGGSKEIVESYLQGSREVMDGLTHNDVNKLGEGIGKDAIVTPVRAEFITGYETVKARAKEAGANGFTISGSGPTVLAVVPEKERVQDVAKAIAEGFKQEGVSSQVYTGSVCPHGTRKI